MMFCPLCGKELTLVVRKNTYEDIDFEDYDPNIQTWNFLGKTTVTNSNPEQDESEWYQDESEWYKCNNCGCFGEDYPLVLHHPLRGMKSKPGDSWSLSWLK
jgi:hypothetical protein